MDPVMDPVMCLISQHKSHKLWMDRQFHGEMGPSLVGGKPWFRRTVAFHRGSHLGDARTTALGEIQLFEKLANPSVPIPTSHDLATAQRFQSD